MTAKGEQWASMAAESTAPVMPRIVLDTDAGGDDAFAMMWLLSICERGDGVLEAITTLAGNTNPKQAFDNVRLLLGLFPELPVARVGIQRATGDVAECLSGGGAAHIHGKDGMGGTSVRLRAVGCEADAAPESSELLEEMLLAEPGQITLLCLGPMTNLARAEARRPGLLRCAREVVWMGGSFMGSGNITELAEFNAYSDPAALATVLNAIDNLVIMPLDVTHHLVLKREILSTLTEDITDGNSKITEHHTALPYTADHAGRREFVIDLAKFMWRSNMQFRATHGSVGFLVHDASVLIYLFYPELVKMRRACVKVSVDDATKGFTWFDARHGPKKAHMNAWVALTVDATEGMAAIIEDLRGTIG